MFKCLRRDFPGVRFRPVRALGRRGRICPSIRGLITVDPSQLRGRIAAIALYAPVLSVGPGLDFGFDAQGATSFDNSGTYFSCSA